MRETLKHSLKSALLLFLLPLAEVVFLRLYLRFYLNLKIGFPGITDYDFFIALPMAFFLYIHSLNEGEKLFLKLNTLYLKLNAFFFLSFILLNHFFYSLKEFSPVLLTILWCSLFISTVLSSLLSFAPLEFFWKNPNRISVIPATLLAFIFPISLYIFKPLWEPFTKIVNVSIHTIFGTLLGNSVNIFYNKENYLVLERGTFRALLGQGCIGFDGFLLFGLVTLILFILYRKQVTRNTWLFGSLSGLFSMYVMNLFRILLLLWMGIYLRKIAGYVKGTALFETFAHAHLGWILYLIGITVHYFAVFKYFTVDAILIRNIMQANLASSESHA